MAVHKLIFAAIAAFGATVGGALADAPRQPDLRQMDLDRDGVVTVREFDDFMAAHRPPRGDKAPPPPEGKAPPQGENPPPPPPQDGARKASPKGPAPQVDRNGDGIVSPAEFDAFLAAHRAGPKPRP